MFWRSPTELHKRCKFCSCILLLCSPSLRLPVLSFFTPQCSQSTADSIVHIPTSDAPSLPPLWSSSLSVVTALTGHSALTGHPSDGQAAPSSPFLSVSTRSSRQSALTSRQYFGTHKQSPTDCTDLEASLGKPNKKQRVVYNNNNTSANSLASFTGLALLGCPERIPNSNTVDLIAHIYIGSEAKSLSCLFGSMRYFNSNRMVFREGPPELYFIQGMVGFHNIVCLSRPELSVFRLPKSLPSVSTYHSHPQTATLLGIFTRSVLQFPTQ